MNVPNMDEKSLSTLTSELLPKGQMRARIWLYLQSLRQLHIQIGNEGDEGFSDLICYRCHRIDAPTDYIVKGFKVRRAGDRVVIEDEANRFAVECEFVRFVDGRTEPLV